MNRFRPSIAGLLGLILAVGLGLAALRGSSSFWYSLTVLGTLTVLLTSILGAIFRRGRSRAFCTGFALFGLALIILIDPVFLANSLDLGLSQIDVELCSWFHPEIKADRYTENEVFIWFCRIVLYEFDLLFALAGGFIGRALADGTGSSVRDGERPDPRQAP
jgi:putative exporter of polyketide antibiotics